jgi:protocatechuate 3,4-dioxygenase beta subunit
LTKTISGRALDENGRPIAGATIYLVNSNLGGDKLAGEATTDENGCYEFRDAQLVGTGVSVSSDGVNEPSEGRRSYQTVSFRLAGIAPGRAFAWRGEKTIYLDHNEAERAGLGKTIIARPDPHLRSFAPWEKIELDLTFAAPQPIAGRIVDEAGKPVAGVTVRLSACFHLDAQGKSAYDYEYFCPNPQPWKAPPAVAEQIYVKTDADGNFRLAAAPPEVVCDLSISHPDYARLTICASTAKNPLRTSRNGEPVMPLPVALKLRSLRTINVTVVRSDSGEPVPEASVWCNEIASALGSGSYGGCGELDKNGRGKLKLPPGKYKLTASLWREVFAHVEEQELTVAESPAEQSLTIKMQPDRTQAR